MSRKILKVLHNQDERADVQECFQGLNVSVVSLYDGAADTAATIIDASLIKLKIYDKSNQVSVFDGTLLEIWSFFHRGEASLNSHMNSSNIVVRTGATQDNGKMMDYSFKFPPLHGDYEIRVETNEAFPANHKQDSFVTVSVDYCKDASEYAWSLSDDTVDRLSDTFKYKGILAATLVNNTKAKAKTAANIYQSVITQVTCSSPQENWSRPSYEMSGVTASFCEEPMLLTYPQAILHNGHVLTSGNFEINTTNTTDFKLYMLHMVMHAEAVYNKSQEIADSNDLAVIEVLKSK